MRGTKSSRVGRNRTILLLRFEEAYQNSNCKSLDGVVSHLQSTFSEYSRMKPQLLTRIVRNSLQQRRLENDYLQSDVDNMSESEFELGLKFDSSAPSTDSGEELEPQFDLMNSVLRDCYGRSKVEKRKLEENFKAEDNRKGKSLKVNEDGNLTERKVWPRFRDLPGMKVVLDELRRKVMVPLCHPQIPIWLGVRPISGILLHGPPGCGKTTLAHAIANEAGVPFYKISATDVVTSASGASEENIRELFLKAQKTAPSIVFIDEIDAIASKREDLQKEMERRIVTQLMTCMDELQRSVTESSDPRTGYVLVIGATNRPDALDPALRRPGRFDREFFLGVPDENTRVEILCLLTRNLRINGDIDLVKIAKATPGFVVADLTALITEASNSAMERMVVHRMAEHSKDPTYVNDEEDWWKRPWLREEVEKESINMADFEAAAKTIQPSSKREGFSTIPNVKWEDIGGLEEIRLQFEDLIVRPIKYPEYHEKFGVDLEAGFLLYGPPGCGKTLIAKAVATEAGVNFIHIKGPQLLNKYVGESEKAIRTIFSRARTCSPCILFFDEIDAVTTKRGKEGGWVVERFLTQFLLELDGAEPRKGVYVIGATNRPEVMDEAFLRPGRFGKPVYVHLPTLQERESILKVVARKKNIASSVDLLEIAKRCQNFSGADLYSLMNEAARNAVREQISESGTTGVEAKHFEEALCRVTPSVSEMQRKHYARLHHRYNYGSLNSSKTSCRRRKKKKLLTN